MSDLPTRQKAAHIPRPKTTIERCCRTCGAAMLGLLPGKTGLMGLWRTERGLRWYCSGECYDASFKTLGVSNEP